MIAGRYCQLKDFPFGAVGEGQHRRNVELLVSQNALLAHAGADVKWLGLGLERRKQVCAACVFDDVAGGRVKENPLVPVAPQR